MAEINELERRKCIVQAGEILKDLGKAAVVSHLTKLGFARSTCYRVLARFQRDGTIERKLGSGRPTVKMTAGKRDV